ncbi:MAG: hypothetical protein EU539_13135 [Promethearchaeota archaeon]|nr:MAG: hypothetical protein EU539_13135 [Candidatus Lokiarchaeota archaeon]
MRLGTLDVVNGIVLIIFCSISIYVGLRIILKYFKYKQRELLLVGLTWIFLVSPWYPGSISFIMFLLTGSILTPEAYFIIGTNLWPIAVVLWIIAFTDLVYKKHQKPIILISIFYGIMFYIIFYYLLLTAPYLIGYLKGYTDVQYGLFIVVYAISLLIIELVTGYLFCKASLESENPQIRLKGKFLLTAFVLFAIGAALDTSIPLTLVTLPIVRGFEILSATIFYMGFILPKWTKKLFLKQE